ncbi:MAG: chromosome condensation regulator [Myxococcaceae bacterium]|nr:chromosome condensation regulator [Myxococcaceae bacterium]
MRAASFACFLVLVLSLVGCHTKLDCSSKNAVEVNGVCQCQYATFLQGDQTVCAGPDGGPAELADGGPAHPEGTVDGHVATAESDATAAVPRAEGGTDPSQADASPEDSGTSAHVDAGFMPATDGATPPCTSNCGPSYVTRLAVGWNHNCALSSLGTVSCWGGNSDSYAGTSVVGKLGPNATGLFTDTPVAVTGLTNVVELAAGRGHTCAIVSSGDVYCWGENDQHQLGKAAIGASSAVPVKVDVTGAVKLAVGGMHSCALLSSATVACWGHAGYGQLAGTSLTQGSDGSVVQVAGLGNIAQVVTGYAHTCARYTNGTVSCWGSNQSGQLGNANVPLGGRSLSSVSVDIQEVDSLSAGISSTCAVWRSQTAACWGDTDSGMLAGKTIANSATPAANVGATDILQLSLGKYHACAALVGGQAGCWGQNDSDQLGIDVGMKASGDPDYVPNLASVHLVGAGEHHTCALLSSGSVTCWGSNNVGQLGPNAQAALSAVPVPVSGL